MVIGKIYQQEYEKYIENDTIAERMDIERKATTPELPIKNKIITIFGTDIVPS